MSEEIDLTGCDDNFQKAEAVEGGFAPLPDGDYTAVIDRAELVRVKQGENKGTPMLTICFRVTGPKYQGRFVWKNEMIRNDPERLKYLKNDLYTLGFKLAKISELPSHLKSLYGIHCAIGLNTRNEYQNVYVNKKIETPKQGAGVAASTLPEENIPF